MKPWRPNIGLLRILSIVSRVEVTGQPITRVAEMDLIDLEHFLLCAEREGMIAETAGGWRITPDGVQWAKRTLDPVAHLIDRMNDTGARPMAVTPTPRYAPPPTRLGIYLSHTAKQTPMREIARRIGVAPSTIMRTVRAIEGWADSTPEWAEVIERTAAWAHGRDETLVAYTPAELAAAFGDDYEEAVTMFLAHAGDLTARRLLVRVASGTAAGISQGGKLRQMVSRERLLFWIAAGWIKPIGTAVATPDSGPNPMRSYAATRAPEGLWGITVDHLYEFRRRNIDEHGRTDAQIEMAFTQRMVRSLGEEYLEIARDWRAVWAAREGSGLIAVLRAEADLHPMLFSVLTDCVAARGGLAEWENENEVPARSAKLLLRIALEMVAEYDEMQTLAEARRPKLPEPRPEPLPHAAE